MCRSIRLCGEQRREVSRERGLCLLLDPGLCLGLCFLRPLVVLLLFQLLSSTMFCQDRRNSASQLKPLKFLVMDPGGMRLLKLS